MKVLNVQQGSVEWSLARAGLPTASEFDALVSPTGEVRTGKMPKTYLVKKLTERWLGGPIVDFNTFDMDQGKILEEHALPYYELMYGETINRVGFITTDDGRIGCSPDGMLTETSGIEIKCPLPHTHIGYLLGGKLPEEYVAQVQGSMFVTGADHWKFMSYCRRFPHLVLTVARDHDYQEALGEALELFLARLNDAQSRLEELNGGPPERPLPRPAPQPEEEPIDLIP